MNRWGEQFQSHPIHATIKEAYELINIEFNDTDSDEQSEKRRLLKLVNLFEETIKGLDAELIPYNLLDQINTAIRQQNVWNQFTAYNSNGNSQHLKNANDHLNNVLLQFTQLLAIAKRSEVTTPLKGLEKSLDEFANAISSKKEKLEDDIDKASDVINKQDKQLEELSTAIITKKQETDTLLATWQEHHSNAQNKRDADFTADQKVRTDAFATWKEEVEQDAKKQLKEIIDSSTETLNAGQNDFDKNISSFIKNAENKHAAILELYELVAGDSVASGYLQSAESDKKQANFWRWAAIAFIVFTAIWTGYAYIADTGIGVSGEILWGKILKAFSVTGVLLFGAAYSAKQSNSHRQSETQARWFALEVKAIDPFISSLSETDQKALKNKLSDRLFAQQHNKTEKEAPIMDENAYTTIVKGITDILKANK